MNCEFLATAQRELREARDYYNRKRAGLGDEFAREVRDATRNILAFPGARPLISERTRRAHTKRFPYGVIYQVSATRF